ncbi:MAG: hypothetical protein DI570_10125 [Phenylobacterium zucineum]|nr:MAG: hypothetical protein DI570_10125 [Phenylobacterium zucineum]
MSSPEHRAEALDVYVFAAPHPRAALSAVEDALDRSAGELAALRLKPVGRIVEATLTLRGLSIAAAEALADRLSLQAGVHALKLEHLRGRA